MRFLALVIAANALSGCSTLAKDDTPLAVLDEIRGLVVTFFEAGDAEEGQQLRVVLSWHLRTPAPPGAARWLADRASGVVDPVKGNFQLDLTTPPPEAAMFSGEDIEEVDLPADARMAFGFVSAFWADSDAVPDWSEGGLEYLEELPYVAGTPELLMVVFYAGSERVGSGQIPIAGGAIEPGFNLVELVPWVDPASQRIVYAYVRMPLSQLVHIPHFIGGGTDFERCRWDLSSPEVVVPVGDPTYPAADAMPEVGSVPCQKCDTEFYTEEFAVAFGLICSGCGKYTYPVDPDDIPDDWPCSVAGQPCEGTDKVCSAGVIYACQDGVWEWDAECDDLADCCNSGCVVEQQPF